MLAMWRLFSFLNKSLPSLVEADLARLNPIQKGLLAWKYTVTMKRMEQENPADIYLQNRS